MLFIHKHECIHTCSSNSIFNRFVFVETLRTPILESPNPKPRYHQNRRPVGPGSTDLRSGQQNFGHCRPDRPIEIWPNLNVVWLFIYTFSLSRIDLSMQRLPWRHWKALKRITYLSSFFRPALSPSPSLSLSLSLSLSPLPSFLCTVY